MNFFDDCNPVDCALEAVESIGLNITPIGLLTRSWDGEKLGLGDPTDTLVLFSPTPRLKSVRNRHMNDEGGSKKKGDLVITLLSKSKYTEADINCISDVDTKEIYFHLKDDLYEVVSIDEKLTHFNVTIKKAKKRKLFL